MEIKIENTQNLTVAAQKFVDEMGENRVFAFYGKMGAGKTTFIKAICEALGVEDVVTSPTFAIVNEYVDAKGEPVYHFDFYRIKNLREAYDIGCEEYFYSGYPCFIEWPELVEELLPEDTVSVRIEVLENEERVVTIA
ncbi:MAG: tRNA (adenosine(37)-N6)-threonylcarbamoyltransferase complex ATPase subunit type 1 TsaE [Bacteroidaceae bacterium]|nr:tRNA (adenosine(37)-N6)-threonylcarbamoyltransferase complex ATPase subunit type 1 TsaE [Bacteroidaceae bacterium]